VYGTLLKPITIYVEIDTLSHFIYEQNASEFFELGDPTKQLGEWGELGGKMVRFESLISVSYFLSIVVKALSLTVLQNPSTINGHKQTDRIGSVDLMLCATRLHRSHTRKSQPV